MNFWETIILFFSFQAILIGLFFLFKRRADPVANKVLAFFLFCFGYCICYNVLFWSELIHSKPFIHLGKTYLIPQGLLAPLFFFYIRRVIDRKKVVLRKDFWHFIPALYCLAAFSPYLIQSAAKKMEIYQEGTIREFVFAPPYIGVILSLIMVGYVYTIFHRYAKKFDRDIDLKIWLNVISISFAGVVFSYLLYYFLWYIQVLELRHDYIITAFMALCIAVVSFFSVNQPEVFNGKSMQEVVPLFKYKKTGLPAIESLHIKDQLMDLMTEQQPYLNSDLRLDDLAKLLNVPRYHASQIINEHFQQNFNDFINKYRVESAIDLLRQPDLSLNMKEIAYRVGFNNYVSFYKAFKKTTGLPPKEFKSNVAYSSLTDKKIKTYNR